MRCFLKLRNCFCLSLRTSNIIISFFFLILSIVFLLKFAITGCKTSISEYAIYGFLILLSLTIVTSSLTLYGIFKKSPPFLKPSLILSAVILLIMLSEIVLMIIFEFALNKRVPGHGGILGKDKFLHAVFAFLITWLLASLKHSYYHELQEELKSQIV